MHFQQIHIHEEREVKVPEPIFVDSFTIMNTGGISGHNFDVCEEEINIESCLIKYLDGLELFDYIDIHLINHHQQHLFR